MVSRIAGLLRRVCFFSVECSLLKLFLSRHRYRLRPRSPLSSVPKSAAPGVSIIRPLKGLDTNLYENLESTFLQDYPNYEILMSVADELDQALPVVRNLIAKYPNIDAKIVIGMIHLETSLHGHPLMMRR